MDESTRLSRLALAAFILSGSSLAMSGILFIVAQHQAGGGFGEVFAFGALRAMLEMGLVAIAATAMFLAGMSLWRYRVPSYTRSSRLLAVLSLFLAGAILTGMAISKH